MLYESCHGNDANGRAVSVLLAAVFLAFIFPSLAGAQEASLPSGETVLDRNVEATGGKATFDGIRNRVVESTLEVSGQGIEIKMTVYAAKPNLTYTVMENEMFGKIEAGTSGNVVWSNSVMQGPQIKKGKERAFMLRASTFDRMVYWRDVYAKAECVALEDIEGKPCYKVVVTPKACEEDPEPKTETCWFDKESGLLAKFATIIENPMGTIPTESYVSDYREVDGIRIPHKLRIMVLGQERVSLVTSVKNNVDLPGDRFEVPAEIRALAKPEK